jgi:magnesium-transporting ATPase (P-type)
VIVPWAKKAYRNLAFAYKDIKLEDFEKVKELATDEEIDFLETNLTFIGIAGI